MPKKETKKIATKDILTHVNGAIEDAFNANKTYMKGWEDGYSKALATLFDRLEKRVKDDYVEIEDEGYLRNKEEYAKV
jgi:hypothetical protein